MYAVAIFEELRRFTFRGKFKSSTIYFTTCWVKLSKLEVIDFNITDILSPKIIYRFNSLITFSEIIKTVMAKKRKSEDVGDSGHVKTARVSQSQGARSRRVSQDSDMSEQGEVAWTRRSGMISEVKMTNFMCHEVRLLMWDILYRLGILGTNK